MLVDGRPGRRWSAEPGQVDRHPDPTSKVLCLPGAQPARCQSRRELDFAEINTAAVPTADEDGKQGYVAFRAWGRRLRTNVDQHGNGGEAFQPIRSAAAGAGLS